VALTGSTGSTKLDQLEMACDGRFTAEHAQLCRVHMDAYDLMANERRVEVVLPAVRRAEIGSLDNRSVLSVRGARL
jgi:hypothetical protein